MKDYEIDGDLVEFVITAPFGISKKLVYKLKSRTTLGVLIELIAGSRNNLIIASPFIQINYERKERVIYEALEIAIKRGVKVDIFTTGESTDLFSENPIFREYKNVKCFRSKQDLVGRSRLGSHAKFCISDDKKAYIGSANLTWPGLYENLEMGILVQGSLAIKVREFWETIFEEGIIEEF
jgi:phosphatidylserine/phosphatidylglycerophosphate/cardiolipin synthase-like enzyme